MIVRVARDRRTRRLAWALLAVVLTGAAMITFGLLRDKPADQANSGASPTAQASAVTQPTLQPATGCTGTITVWLKNGKVLSTQAEFSRPRGDQSVTLPTTTTVQPIKDNDSIVTVTLSGQSFAASGNAAWYHDGGPRGQGGNAFKASGGKFTTTVPAMAKIVVFSGSGNGSKLAVPATICATV